MPQQASSGIPPGFSSDFVDGHLILIPETAAALQPPPLDYAPDFVNGQWVMVPNQEGPPRNFIRVGGQGVIASTNAPGRNASTPCNGSPLFCQMRYDQYTFPASYLSGSYNLEGDCNTNDLNGYTCDVFQTDQCYYYNNGDRDFLTQLEYGIRGFNMQFCQFGTGPQLSYAVQCSKVDGTRALGEDFADTVDALRAWLDSNPYDVIELELDIAPGENNTVISPYVQEVLHQRLNGVWLRRSVVTREWPTIGEMIDFGKRVVIFVSDDFYSGLVGTPPSWFLLASLYYLPSLAYTMPQALPPPNATNFLTLNQFEGYLANVPYNLTLFCRHPDVDLLAGRWQNLDMEFPTLYRCPEQVANTINQFAREIAFYCLPKVYFHRLRGENYFTGFQLPALLNHINLARYQLLLASVTGANGNG